MEFNFLKGLHELPPSINIKWKDNFIGRDSQISAYAETGTILANKRNLFISSLRKTFNAIGPISTSSTVSSSQVAVNQNIASFELKRYFYNCY